MRPGGSRGYILLIIALVTAIGAWGQQHATDRLNPLYAWHASWNEYYFNNELPAVEFYDLHDARFQGLTTYFPAENKYRIGINLKYNPTWSELNLTALHEECHVWLQVTGANELDIHGPLFQACMQRLAAQGALKELW